MIESDGRRYLEWLESSCFNIVKEQLGPKLDLSEQQIMERAVGIVKMHALFGSNVAIDSMCLLGSQVLLTMFCDAEFRRYLVENPAFIKIVSVYREGEELNSRREIVMSGLARATQPDWVPTTFRETEPIKRMSTILLEAHEIDPGALLSDLTTNGAGAVIRDWASYRTYLEGIIYGAAHFVNQKDVPISRGSKSKRVFDILRETKEQKHIGDEHHKLIDQTFDFISATFEEPNKASHSQIILEARKRLSNPLERRQVLQTTSHAFNAGLVRSIDPEYGSYEFFPYGAPVGLYLDSLRDVLVPSTALTGKRSRLSRSLRFIHLAKDPRDISWMGVRNACSDSRVVESAAAFQAALRENNNEQIEDAIDNHVRVLNEWFVEETEVPRERWVWVVGGVGVLIGMAAGSLETAIGAGGSAATATEMVRQLVYLGRRYVVAETIRDRARKLVPRSQIPDERPVHRFM